jgi:flagellar motor switch protein FliN/FliY
MTETNQEKPPNQKSVSEMTDFLDVPMKITFELGRNNMQVREVLRLKQESLVEIPKSAGENLDIYIDGELIGYGEILDMEGTAGVRLTDFHEKP